MGHRVPGRARAGWVGAGHDQRTRGRRAGRRHGDFRPRGAARRSGCDRRPTGRTLGGASLPERVYSSGFDDLAALAGDANLGNFDWSPKDRRELPAIRGRVQSIQTGRVLLGGAERLIGGLRDPAGAPIEGEVPRVSVDLGGIGGGSGRPILSSADHRVVAIHASSGTISRKSSQIDLSSAGGADAAGASMVVPARAILADLARRLADGAIAGEDAALVGGLLQRSGP